MRQFILLVGAAVLGSIGTLTVYETVYKSESPAKLEKLAEMPLSKVAYRTNEAGEVVNLDFTAAAEKVMPAVVAIKSIGNPSERRIQKTPFDSEFFEPFFGPSKEMPSQSTGSGVIINPDGYIVTNNHVVQNADIVEVTLTDNRTIKAKIIGTDPDTDLAVIKIDAKDLPTLAFVDSDKVKVGEWVLAIGNPYNLSSTVTAGIISAKGRSIDIIQNNNPQGNTAIESFIQTDAAINPGNSGGALVTLNGGLVGINTAIASPTGSYSGYGFAVPANLVHKIAEDLIKSGEVQRGWLGVSITSVTSELAKEKDLNVKAGAFVAGFAEASNAREAGVREGDVIVKIDATEIKSSTSLTAYIGTKRPGDKVTLVINRAGQTVTVPVVLKGKSDSKTASVSKLVDFGIELEKVEPAVLRKLDLKSGVKIKSIKQGKILSETEIQEGFIITRVNDTEVTNVEEVLDMLKSKKSGELVILTGTYEKFPKEFNYAFRR